MAVIEAADAEERSLGQWVLEQRRRGTPERATILDAVLPGWRSVREATWHTTLAQVDGWRDQNHPLPRADSQDNTERHLGSWLRTQRTRTN